VAALAVAIARSRSTVGVGSRSMPSRAVLVTADTRLGVEVDHQIAADHAQALLVLLVADVGHAQLVLADVVRDQVLGAHPERGRDVGDDAAERGRHVQRAGIDPPEVAAHEAGQPVIGDHHAVDPREAARGGRDRDPRRRGAGHRVLGRGAADGEQGSEAGTGNNVPRANAHQDLQRANSWAHLRRAPPGGVPPRRNTGSPVCGARSAPAGGTCPTCTAGDQRR
jgi:hypothetical protein